MSVDEKKPELKPLAPKDKDPEILWGQYPSFESVDKKEAERIAREYRPMFGTRSAVRWHGASHSLPCRVPQKRVLFPYVSTFEGLDGVQLGLPVCSECLFARSMEEYLRACELWYQDKKVCLPRLGWFRVQCLITCLTIHRFLVAVR